MNRHKFANQVAVADARFGAFALVLEILRSHPHRRVGVKDIVLFNLDRPFDTDVSQQAGTSADLDAFADNAVGSDLRALIMLELEWTMAVL